MKITLRCLLFISLLSSGWLSAQSTLLSESFETDGNGTRYTTSVTEFSDGFNDFFTRTDGSNISGSYVVTGSDGSFYFAAQDIDGEGSAAEQTLSFSGIDISNFENLSFNALFAEDDAGDSNEDWDDSDFLTVEYQIDGGGFQNLLAIAEIDDGDAFNQQPGIDTDFDGTADGAPVTSMFTSFGNAISGTGTTLDVRITISLDAGDEDIAIDLIEVTGDAITTSAPLISEFQPNPAGTDPSLVTIELSGNPGEAFSGWFISIESDLGNPGVVDRASEVSGTFDANGLLTVSVPDLENPSFTVALLSDFTGDTSTDIDTNDDGVADDVSTFGDVFDAIGVPDATGEPLYGTDLGGIDFAFTGDEPRLIFRDASVGDLYAINDPDGGQVFDIFGMDVTPAVFNTDPTIGTDTFGVINPSVGGVVQNTIGIVATDADKEEGDAGTTSFVFTVTRSGDTTGATSVDFAVTSGEADATDFGGVLPSGTVNFAADSTEGFIDIAVSGDTVEEADELFTVTLSNPANGETLGPVSADGTIQDDDAVAPLVSIVINEIHADPASDLSGDANGDGIRDATQDEFVELVNTGASPLDISGWTLSDGVLVRHTFPINTILNPDQAIVVFGGNTPTGSFGGAVVQTASSGALGLNNGGDTVTINDGVQDVAIQTYGSEGGSNQSLTRDPDRTGNFVQHSTATGAGGALFSPGTLIDGTPFSGNDVPLPNVALNELRISTGGSSDNVSNYVEVFGDPNASLSGLSIVVLSGEFEPGQVDFAFDLSSGSTDANGVFLLANADIATAIPDAELDPTDIIQSFDFFGSPTTFLLVQNFNGTQGSDLDADNDGTLDSDIGTIIDSVSLVDGDGTADISYSTNIFGPDGNFTPAGLAREEDGTGNFQTLDFGDVSLDTPGFSNVPDVIEPGETTLIHAIQGTTDLNLLDGQVVTVEAIVVGDFQDGDADTSRDLRGFYLQEEDSDADTDPLTSEGIFIFEGNGPTSNDINVGDLVQVTGTVDEFFNETQLDQITNITIISSGNTLPSPATISLPSTGTIVDQAGDIAPDLEAYEGMLVRFPQTLTITEMFQLDRFNEIKLSEGGRLVQFTQTNTPDVTGFTAHLESNGARTITYDDGLNQQNTLIGNLDGFGPTFSTATDIRMGDTINGLSGVLSYQWAGNNASQATWRVRATQNGENTFEKVNFRQNAPEEVGGTLKVASLNVLNYFTTLDDETPRNGMPLTSVGLEPRGANDLTAFGINPATAEFDRQNEKLVNALIALDADVIGLVELENEFLAGAPGTAIENLVNELNAIVGADTYQWVDPGSQFVGDDAIAVGLIYKTTAVSIAEGTSVEILTDADLPSLGLGDLPAVFDGPSTNRVPLAVTFKELATGGVFTAVVNHFKSKGSPGTSPTGDVDINDGAGNGNQTRLNGAIALDAWLDTDPTGSGDEDIIILGDLNAYPEEDPIIFLEGEGYVDLAQLFVGPTAASFVFDGQIGTLDYAMANTTLLTQISGATEWAVNSNEPDAIDYNLDFGRDPSIFDGSVPFRNSDHDPIVVGMDLSPSELTILGFSLVDAENDEIIQPLTEGLVVDIATLPTSSLSIVAVATDDTGSVFLELSGELSFNRTESIVPYALFGDSSSNFSGNDFSVGDYTITATAYSGSNGSGDIGTPLTVNFSVVDNPSSVNEITALILVDADTNADIIALTDGIFLDLDSLPTTNLNVRAEASSDVESVLLQISGDLTNTRTENVEPYALFGDSSGNYSGRIFSEGSYSLSAIPYTEDNLNGTKGTPLSLSFSLNNSLSTAAFAREVSDNALKIYPNPANVETTAIIENGTEIRRIMVFDMLGRLVRTFEPTGARASSSFVMDVNTLPVGNYFIKTEDKRGTQLQTQMVIQR